MDRSRHESPSRAGQQISRRTVAKIAAATTALAAAGVLRPATALAEGEAQARFVRISEFLTRRKLDPLLGARYYTALKKHKARFDDDVSRLMGEVDQAKAVDVDAFLASPQLDAASLAAATTIISAWYMGVVGDGADTELVTYADALMYAPTRGILVVPSYGSGPNSWGDKPS
jgi:hypothetical protein